MTHRSTHRLLAAALGVFWIAVPAAADFTEFEDQPFLAPGGAEVDALNDAEPIPFDGAPFLDAYPAGAKLVRGNLDADDIDTYEVDLASGDLLLAALFDPDGGAFLDLVLGTFAGGALPALALDDDGGRGFHARLGHVAAGAGAVQVGVSGFGDTDFDGTHDEAREGLAAYDLVLAVARDGATPTESENNDTTAKADLVTGSGGLVRGTLLPGDVDHFAIDLEEGDRLLVSIFDLRAATFDLASGETNDPVLRVYDAVGAPFEEDDDAGPGFLPNRAITVPPGGAGRWTVAVSGFGDTAFDGSHTEPAFDYFAALVRDRACPSVATLVSGISTSTGKTYVRAELAGGDHYYTDRTNPQTHVLVDVPDDLECSEWIKTANNDKNVSADPHLTFTLGAAASVFIGYDTRASAEPAWLASDFTPLGSVLDIADSDVNQEFDLLRRDFPAGTVELGGNQAAGANSNYTVVVKPVNTSEAGRTLAMPPLIGDGNYSVTVSGVVVTVPTATGMTRAALAQALADAVNANGALQTARVFGLAVGDVLVVTGSIDGVDVGFVLPVPGLGPPAIGVLLVLLVAVAWRVRSSLQPSA